MSVQFSGVLQSLRKRRNKLQQGCARCQQLLEGLKSRTATLMVCKKNDATGKLDSPKKDYKSESSAESGSELGTDYDSESDPETDWTLFHRAVIGGKYEVVQDLLKEGVDVNIQSKIGRTALHEASYRGYDSIVRILLENSADTDIRDEFGRTALREASYTGRDQIVQMLLESRVDVNARDEVHHYQIFEIVTF
jgi:ankyrin repeat protein